MADDSVSSRFSIVSGKLDSVYLSHHFSWPVTETERSNDKIEYHITTFDLGVGHHARVDKHLDAAARALLEKETELSRLSSECHYALWVRYRYSKGDGAFNLSARLLAAFGFLRVEVIFHLNEF
jgi:hypothetical protein